MLVQFMLRNVLSFKDETVLDMTAVCEDKEHKRNLIDYHMEEKFLRVAAIYGANASGKSNLHQAMYCFIKIVEESFNNVSNEGYTAIHKYYVPFDFEQEKENSEFQIILMDGDFEYQYGYEYNAECIVCEWMYQKNIRTNIRSTIFERTTNYIEFGELVREECDVYKMQIPVDALALSFFNKLKIKTTVFSTVYWKILGAVEISSVDLENDFYLKKELVQLIDKDKKALLEFLRAVDAGIHDIRYEVEDKQINFYTTHLDRNGKEYHMHYLTESGGTLQSIAVFICVRIVILRNSWLFVDELNLKLHPLLLKFIIDIFYHTDSTAQLIYTTHDTALLDKKYFRKDQIWFVQKDRYGYSELVALSDYKVRSDASFETDYLAGVYGGIRGMFYEKTFGEDRRNCE